MSSKHQDYLDQQRKAIRDRMNDLYPLDIRDGESLGYVPDRDMARVFAETEDGDRTAEFLSNYTPQPAPQKYFRRNGEPAGWVASVTHAHDLANAEYVQRNAPAVEIARVLRGLTVREMLPGDCCKMLKILQATARKV